ncbi:unnamed protein product [Peniophora sp. CBMAI 1063]|nr:unnamed protein product [Peniophora sp. CBMAI 1063]
MGSAAVREEAPRCRTPDPSENTIIPHQQRAHSDATCAPEPAQAPSPVLINEYPPRRYRPIETVRGPIPAESGQSQPEPETARQQERIQPVLEFGMIAFAGSTFSGFIGTVFAIIAMLLAVADRHPGARRALWLSSACAVISAVGIIAGTQTWAVTVLTVVGMALMLGAVMCPAKESGKTPADVEETQSFHEA